MYSFCPGWIIDRMVFNINDVPELLRYILVPVRQGPEHSRLEEIEEYSTSEDEPAKKKQRKPKKNELEMLCEVEQQATRWHSRRTVV
jgi:hypothetical protein